MKVVMRSLPASPITSTSGNLCCLNLLITVMVHTLPMRATMKMMSRVAVLGKSISAPQSLVSLAFGSLAEQLTTALLELFI